MKKIKLYVIFDREHASPYIHLTMDKNRAEYELKELLKPYGKNSEWRKRLYVNAITFEQAKQYPKMKIHLEEKLETLK